MGARDHTSEACDRVGKSVSARSIITAITERQISDDTRLRRVVALFQRELGGVFGNAKVRRRNRRYEIDVAVYEKPIPASGEAYRMSRRQIVSWIKQASDRAHPRLYRRLQVDVQPWQVGRVSRKLFAPVRVLVDAAQPQQPASQSVEQQQNEP